MLSSVTAFVLFALLGTKVVVAALGLAGIRFFDGPERSIHERALPVRLLFGGRVESWEGGLFLCALLVLVLVGALPLLSF